MAVHANENCLAVISTWMENNLVKLNQNETKLTVYSSKQSVNKTGKLRLKVGSSYIGSARSLSNLGITLDNSLGMEKQVNAICKSCYYQIRCIGNALLFSISLTLVSRLFHDIMLFPKCHLFSFR